MPRARAHIVEELVSSEERYTEQLRSLVYEFFRPLSRLQLEGTSKEDREKLQAVFNDLERILPLNERFMLSLKALQLS